MVLLRSIHWKVLWGTQNGSSMAVTESKCGKGWRQDEDEEVHSFLLERKPKPNVVQVLWVPGLEYVNRL